MSGEKEPVCLPEEEKRGKKQDLNEDKRSSGTTCLQPLFFFFSLSFFLLLDLRSGPIDSDDRYAAGQ